jgi:succinate dehydrogenase/fumarate reductase flavoprotein subunit
VLASGGINAALGTRDPEDSWQQHFADTLLEGYLLGDPRVVEVVTREAPRAIEELAAWGCHFARTDDGQLDQRFFGAHRWRRTCYAGDFSGRAVLHTLADYPEMDDSLQVNFLTQLDDDGSLREPWPEPVPPVSAELEQFLADQDNLALKGRLLE